jgi:hypothetical protein
MMFVILALICARNGTLALIVGMAAVMLTI